MPKTCCKTLFLALFFQSNSASTKTTTNSLNINQLSNMTQKLNS